MPYNTKLASFFLCAATLALCLIVSPRAAMGAKAISAVALMTSEQGVWVDRNGKRITLKQKTAIHEGDVIYTDSKGQAQLLFTDGTVAALAENSSLGLCAYSYKPKEIPVLYATLQYGFVRFISGRITSRNINGIAVETTDALVVPHGGSFSVQLIPGAKTIVTVVELNGRYPVSVTNLITRATHNVTLRDKSFGVTVAGKRILPLLAPHPKYTAEQTVLPTDTTGQMHTKNPCGYYLTHLRKRYQAQNKAYMASGGKPIVRPPVGGGIVPPIAQTPPIDGGPIEVPPIIGGPMPLPPITGGPAPIPPIDGGPAPIPPIDGGPEPIPPIDGGPEPIPPIDGGPAPIPPIDGGPAPISPIDPGPIQAPPISWGPIEVPPIDIGPAPIPPIDGGPILNPPIDGGPILNPPIDGGPILNPPIDGGPIQVPPIDGGPILLPPIDGGPIEIKPDPTATYSGQLTSWGNARGTFSFAVSLTGSSGQITNAVLNMSTGSVETLKAINGSAAIQSGNFSIQNFTVSNTNIPAGQVGKVDMTGTINRTTTSGTWQIFNSGNLSVRHNGDFSGKK